MAPSIALVSREIAPLVGGGIAPVVRNTGELLASCGWDVTFVTDRAHRGAWDALVDAGDPIAGTQARWVWVDAPPDRGEFLCDPHAWSARIDEGLREAFPDRAPDIIEFCDFFAEGFVTVQRRAASDPWLDRTLVCLRTHTTAELVSVLNGAIGDDTPDAALFEMERYCLERADRLIVQCDEIYRAYGRFYAECQLAPAAIIRAAVAGATSDRDQYATLAADASARSSAADAPLRLLYVGRFERRKGVVTLVEAIARRPDLNLQLTLIGADTDTGPLGGSIRQHLEHLAAADPRISVGKRVRPEDVPVVMVESDAVVLPSAWECWPNVALEALQLGRPVLSTPVGGLSEMVRVGTTGFQATGTTHEALERLLEQAVAEKEALRELSRQDAFWDHVEQLTATDAIASAYRDLATAADRRTVTVVPTDDRIAVILPYFQLDHTIGATLDSLAAQTHRALDVVIVNDGSFREEDRAMLALADLHGARVISTPNRGLSSARNTGLDVTDAPFVCMLDPDDELDPRFLASCLHALHGDPSLAYATTWVQYIDEAGEPHPDPDRVRGYFPFGNWSRLMSRHNVAGVCTSVMRRSALEGAPSPLRYSPALASYEDWDLYRQLAERGEFGVVLPERWFRYRVRPASMTRQDAQPNVLRLMDELRAAHRARQSTWITEEAAEWHP